MRPSEVLLEVAQTTNDGVGFHRHYGLDDYFNAMKYMSLMDNGDANYWMGYRKKISKINHRVIALCLAAAIAQSEGE